MAKEMIQSKALQMQKSVRVKEPPIFISDKKKGPPGLGEGHVRRATAAAIMVTQTPNPFQKVSPLVKILTQNHDNDDTILVSTSTPSLVNIQLCEEKNRIIPSDKVGSNLDTNTSCPQSSKTVGVVKPEFQIVSLNKTPPNDNKVKKSASFQDKRRCSTVLTKASPTALSIAKAKSSLDTKVFGTTSYQGHTNWFKYLWIIWIIQKIVFGVLIYYLINHIRDLKPAPVVEQAWWKWLIEKILDKLGPTDLFLFGVMFILARVGIRGLDFFGRKLEIWNNIQEEERRSSVNLKLKEMKLRNKTEIWKTVTDGVTKVFTTIIRSVLPMGLAEEVLSKGLDILKEKVKEKAADKERARADKDKLSTENIRPDKPYPDYYNPNVRRTHSYGFVGGVAAHPRTNLGFGGGGTNQIPIRSNSYNKRGGFKTSMNKVPGNNVGSGSWGHIEGEVMRGKYIH